MKVEQGHVVAGLPSVCLSGLLYLVWYLLQKPVLIA